MEDIKVQHVEMREQFEEEILSEKNAKATAEAELKQFKATYSKMDARVSNQATRISNQVKDIYGFKSDLAKKDKFIEQQAKSNKEE